MFENFSKLKGKIQSLRADPFPEKEQYKILHKHLFLVGQDEVENSYKRNVKVYTDKIVFESHELIDFRRT